MNIPDLLCSFLEDLNLEIIKINDNCTNPWIFINHNSISVVVIISGSDIIIIAGNHIKTKKICKVNLSDSDSLEEIANAICHVQNYFEG